MKNWSRNEIIALASLFVTIIGCLAAVVVIPEVRLPLGLELSKTSSAMTPPSSTPTDAPTATPTPMQPLPTQTPTAMPEIGGGGATGRPATLTLANYSSQEICYVYISPTTDAEWGDDWLEAQETVLSGASRDFEVPAGSYDLLARDCDSNVLDEQYDVSVAGTLEWTLRNEN